ncbi:MAG: Scr1 family TA system antitoxin-like transcriptional regulator [Gammaproteobacteria bacterium]
MNKTVSSKMLGARLRAMRETAGLSVRAVSEEVGCSHGKVSQQEGGYRPVSPAELHLLVIGLYGGDHEQLDQLKYLRQRATEGRGWWTETGLDLPEHFAAYLGLEADAEYVRAVALEIIPGLLQTEGYARAQHTLSGKFTSDDVDGHIAVRMRRQQRLHDTEHPLRLDAVISEGALRRCGHHPDCDQLPALAERAQLPTVDLRVLPFSAGIHDMAGQLSVAVLPKNLLPPVGHEETAAAGLLIENEAAVAHLIDLHTTLRDRAHDPKYSLDLIRQLAAASTARKERETMPDQNWRKASYSATNNTCVEVADRPGAKAVRDSKLGDASPILTVPAAQFAALTDTIQAGRLTG